MSVEGASAARAYPDTTKFDDRERLVALRDLINEFLTVTNTQ